jgi:Tfp pilus assembly protein PilW
MLMNHRLIEDESGMTLIELLVATAAGVVVMFGVVLAVIVTLRETDRVASHVDANQRSRTTMYKVIDELHSACVASQFAPVQTGSTGTSLSFIHKSGSAVALTPVLSTVSLSGTTLSQSDYTPTGGSAPTWTFSGTPSSTVQLMTGVNPLSGSSIFSYYAYSNGQVSSTPLTTPLSSTDAAKTVQVSVAFNVAPTKTQIVDPNAPTAIQDSALLRFSAATFSTSASNLPCQ